MKPFVPPVPIDGDFHENCRLAAEALANTAQALTIAARLLSPVPGAAKEHAAATTAAIDLANQAEHLRSRLLAPAPEEGAAAK